MRYVADATQDLRKNAAATLEALIQQEGLSVDARSLIASDIVVSGLPAMARTLEMIVGIDLSEVEDRARLSADIAEIALNGLVPRS
jgi:hypothetical protein